MNYVRYFKSNVVLLIGIALLVICGVELKTGVETNPTSNKGQGHETIAKADNPDLYRCHVGAKFGLAVVMIFGNKYTRELF